MCEKVHLFEMIENDAKYQVLSKGLIGTIHFIRSQIFFLYLCIYTFLYNQYMNAYMFLWNTSQWISWWAVALYANLFALRL